MHIILLINFCVYIVHIPSINVEIQTNTYVYFLMVFDPVNIFTEYRMSQFGLASQHR